MPLDTRLRGYDDVVSGYVPFSACKFSSVILRNAALIPVINGVTSWVLAWSLSKAAVTALLSIFISIIYDALVGLNAWFPNGKVIDLVAIIRFESGKSIPPHFINLSNNLKSTCY